MMRHMPKEPKPHSATPDELNAIDEALAERSPSALRLVADAIGQIDTTDPDALALRIVQRLRRAGYEVRPISGLIPTRPDSV